MNISSVSSANSSTTQVASVGAVGPAGLSDVSLVSPPGGAAASASISTPGQFFSQMQQLSQQNPTAFKSVAAEVATTFQNAASQTTGQQAQLLNKLANVFSQASQTGSLQAPEGGPFTQALQATQGGSGQAGGSTAAHHHHHHHHGGGGGALPADSSSSDVQQAYESVLSIVTQATQGGST
jgi:hypothetical protein